MKIREKAEKKIQKQYGNSSLSDDLTNWVIIALAIGVMVAILLMMNWE